MTDSRADRLRAAIDETQRIAQAASPGPWKLSDTDEVLAVDDVTVADVFALSSNQLRATVEHITRHDPAAVLRRCAADRKILDLHHDWHNCTQWDDSDYGRDVYAHVAAQEACDTVKALAEAYGVEA